MSDTLSDISNDTPSTVLEDDATSTAVGAGADEPEGQRPEEEKPKPEPEKPVAPKSRRETIKAAAEKLDKEENPQTDKEKPEEAVKPEHDEKGGAKDGSAGPESEKPGSESGKPEEKPADKPEDKERFREPPKRFLTKAKETWINTPNSVKSEVIRLERDYDELSQRAQENEQYRAGLKIFEDYAERNGVKLSQALEVFTSLDALLKQNPVQAVAEILKTVKLTPQQYAQIVQENSPQYQAQMLMPRQQAQPQQPQLTPREQQLQAQLAQEQAARVNAEVIAPFAEKHPRFAELQETVVRCLNSGMIPDNLAPYDRLEAAYDMAERLSPRSASSTSQATPAQTTAQTANPRAGKSQISGAPSSGQSTNPVRRGKMSRREALSAALDKASAS
ncbi:hypothetical protein HK16_01200 [Acetobacter senegalensis]|uniref:Uncharacterized protein n=2 Tax=Acetobacter TaxID=434 RepID=A0A252EF03_9PROT|nr:MULTISPECIES: hypothetical protein [Acetobacter]ATJ90439.1 hypothetical protein CIW82_06795 [Acetobacter tropicalis]OUL64882.1 hypothetical protein HK16_01200 [Acetobacter senegalensis]